MKKFVILLVVLATVFTLTACARKETAPELPRPSAKLAPPSLVYKEFELEELPPDYAELTRHRVFEVIDNYPDPEFSRVFGKLLREELVPIVILSAPKRKAVDGTFVAALSFAAHPELEGGVWPEFKVNPRVCLNKDVPDHVLWRTLCHESVHIRQFLAHRLPILPPGVIREYTPEEASRYFEIEAGAHRVENEEAARFGWPAQSDIDIAYRDGGVLAMRVTLARTYCESGWHTVHCELFKEQALVVPN